ncbi:uncharacterized protein LOC112523760 [Cynara cardunculus var. scolymus]|uniref:uncharacterized protein LOC112523760 n=1 Tax=Cynara cardunculus var. scolymus TaxID=59895 RepID=UPI000D62D77D|nr:uncharacterized protein LOC112523760 [Cynara cardunculus var. scolymus]
MLNENGIFFFKFNDVGGCDQAIEAGPLMISGIPLFLHRWDPSKGLRKPVHSSCPLWVKLHNIPLVAFNREGVSRVASVLGIPKQMDSCTAAMCEKAWGRPEVVKVLVEVWAIGELKRKIEVEIPNLNGGDTERVQIEVAYLWEPIQCSHCQIFGHKFLSCAKAASLNKGKHVDMRKDSEGFIRVEKKQWRPKCRGKHNQSSTRQVIEIEKYGPQAPSLEPFTSRREQKKERNMGTSKVNPVVQHGNNARNASGDSETHVSKDSLESICHNSFGRWYWMSNQAVCESGTRIILAWDSRVLDVMVLEIHSQFLICKVLLRGGQDYIFFSLVYGANVCTARRELWSGLLKFKVLIGSHPWIVIGDFNSMLFPHDGFGGSSRRNMDMSEFCMCVEDVEIFDIHYTGVHFTWNQKPNSKGGIMRKLDRAIANSEFTSKFHDACVQIHPLDLSDHSPMVLSFKGGARKRRYGFKFDNFLTDHPAFLQVVKDEWANHIEGTFMFHITSHLKALKTLLRKLRNSYGNLGKRVSFLKTELDRIQLDVDMDPSNDELGLELGHIRIAYQNACWDEECAAKQRAKIK